MNRYIEQHIRFQKRRFTKRGRGIQIVSFPVLFIGFFLFAPGWWGHQQVSMPMGLDEATGWCLGVIITALGGALYLWTIALFAKAQGTQAPVAPTQRLVTSGPYAVSRNPMLTSAIIMVCGGGVGLDSWSFMAGGLVIPTAYLVYIRVVEERELEARFGQEYLSYKRATPFIVPRLRSHLPPAALPLNSDRDETPQHQDELSPRKTEEPD
jgi:protein-S-isoprenylcysteine O-methyltransferase Ste14